MIELLRLQGAPGYIIKSVETSNEVLVQTDYDYPSVAGAFGWNMRDTQVMQAGYYGQTCDHSSTDGTVKCDGCGLTPTTFINEAREYLDSHIGAKADDPGYF